MPRYVLPKDSTLLYKLDVGDKFTTTLNRNKVFEITGRKGDTTYVKEVATGKTLWWEHPDTWVVKVDESATYQKKRFLDPVNLEEAVKSAVKKVTESVRLSNEDDLYYWMLDYMEKNKGKGSTSLQFITNNGNNIIISWNMKQYNGISIDGQKMNMGEFCHHRMKGVGIQDVWEVDMNTGRFKPIKEDAPQKIVIKNAWGVEVKDYKAGDPIPAGAKFKIFNAKDTDKIEAYADSLFESLSSRNHTFKPEELKVGKKVIDNGVKGTIMINHNDLYKDNKYRPEMKGSTRITVKRDDNGRSYDVDANDSGGEFILEGCKGKKKISEGYTVIFPTGASQKLKTIADVNKFVNGVLHMKDKNASDVQLTDAMLDKWNKENDIPLVVVKESIESQVPLWTLKKGQKFRVPYDTNIHKAGEQLFKITYVSDHQVDAIDDKGVPYTWENPAQTMVIKEGRIAKGYENLDADEKARHLLSHPSSKYMSDLKSENITERAIRKAVKEMLGKPDKDDPIFIQDVEEGCIKESAYYVKFSQDGKSSKYYTYANGKHGWTDNKSAATQFSTKDEAEASLKKNPYYDAFNMKYFDVVQESFLIVGKLPYDDLKQAYISYSDKGLDLHTPEYKKHATRFSSRQEAQKVLDLMKKEGWKTEKFEIVQEEGEAPATTTANVATPELPMKLKECKKRKLTEGVHYNLIVNHGKVVDIYEFYKNNNEWLSNKNMSFFKKYIGKDPEFVKNDIVRALGIPMDEIMIERL